MKTDKTRRLVLHSLFCAIIVVMAMTPLGYLKISVVEISLLMIPVALGAIFLGPVSGAFFGTVFGLTSFIQCFGFSPFGVMLFGINPYSTFVLVMGPRILIGYLSGVIYLLVKKASKNEFASCSVAGLFAAVLNTVSFFLVLISLFGREPQILELMDSFAVEGLFAFFVAFVGTNGLIEAIVSFIAVGTIGKFTVPLMKK